MGYETLSVNMRLFCSTQCYRAQFHSIVRAEFTLILIEYKMKK